MDKMIYCNPKKAHIEKLEESLKELTEETEEFIKIHHSKAVIGIWSKVDHEGSIFLKEYNWSKGHFQWIKTVETKNYARFLELSLDNL